MKNSILTSVILLMLSIQSQAGVTINLTAGQLLNSTGSAAMGDGKLIQLIEDTNANGFTAPTSTSFTGGSDDVVLASFAMDSSTSGLSGAIVTSIIFNINSSDAGKPMLLRWFPLVDAAASAPGAGVAYGEFRSDSLLDGSDIAWLVPADGKTVTLNFQTTNAGGTQANAAGKASLSVAQVPEPSTFALLGMGVGFAGWMARRNKKA